MLTLFFVIPCINFVFSDVLLDLFGSSDNVVNQMDACVKNIRNTKTVQSTSQFSDEQIAGFCAKHQMWRQGVRRAQQRLSDGAVSEFTDNQLRWMSGIQRCDDLPSCLSLGGGRKAKTEFRDEKLLPELRSADANFTSKRKKRATVPLSIRKEIRRLTDGERANFLAALEELKFDKIDNKSKYDLLTLYHRPESAPGAHWGPAFLGWHRELLRELEVSLKQYDSTVVLPYWDSTLDEGLPDPSQSVLFSDAFIGGDDVKPFAHWKTYYPVGGAYAIKRSIGKTPFGFLLKQSDVQKVTNFTAFGQLTMCVDPFFELVHGGPHNWLGGHMADIPISPDDPAFYLHHTFVDYIWEQFRMKKQSEETRKSQYPSKTDSCNSFHFEEAPMKPYPRKNKDGLSNRFRDSFYQYEPSPTCRFSKPQNCNSKYLFCDKKNERCLSKVVPGGNCTAFEGTEICYESTCVKGKCEKTLPSANAGSAPSNGPKPESTSAPEKVDSRAGDSTAGECECAKRTEGKDAKASKYVYFPITVFYEARKNLRTFVYDAQILSIGAENVGITEGKLVHAAEGYPNYPGNAIASAPNPFYHNGLVDLLLEVSASNLTCKAHCYSGKDIGYTPCSGKVSLDRHGLRNPEFAVSEHEQQALYLAWDGQQKVPTPFMFLCEIKTKDSQEIQKQESKRCRFQRFTGFELLNHATKTYDNVDKVTTCKQKCKEQKSPNCKSLLYYPLQEKCVLNDVDRLTYADQFKYNRDEDVVYMDYRCDFENAFEE